MTRSTGSLILTAKSAYVYRWIVDRTNTLVIGSVSHDRYVERSYVVFSGGLWLGA